MILIAGWINIQHCRRICNLRLLSRASTAVNIPHPVQEGSSLCFGSGEIIPEHTKYIYFGIVYIRCITPLAWDI